MIDLPNIFDLNVDITSKEQIILYSQNILIRLNFPIDIVLPTKHLIENFREILENHIKNAKESSDY